MSCLVNVHILLQNDAKLWPVVMGKTVGDDLTLFLTLSLTLNLTLTLALTLLLTLNQTLNVTVTELGRLPRFCRSNVHFVTRSDLTITKN